MTISVIISETGDTPAVSAMVATGIVANTGGASGATLLTAVNNIITNCVTNAAVALQPVPGDVQRVVNASGHGVACGVYPAAGTNFVNLATLVPFGTPVGDGAAKEFLFDGISTWYPV